MPSAKFADPFEFSLTFRNRFCKAMALELPKVEVVSASPTNANISEPAVVCWLADASVASVSILEFCLLNSNYLSQRVILFAHAPPSTGLLGFATDFNSLGFRGLDADEVTLAAQQLKSSILRAKRILPDDDAAKRIEVFVDVDATVDFAASLARCLTAPSSILLVPVQPSLVGKNHLTRFFSSTWEERILFAVESIGNSASVVFLHRRSNTDPLSNDGSTLSERAGSVLVVILDLSLFLPSHVVPHIARAAIQHAGPHDGLLLCGMYNLPPVVEYGAHEIHARRDWSEEARLSQKAAAETLQSACRITRQVLPKGSSVNVNEGILVGNSSLVEVLTQARGHLQQGQSSAFVGAVVVPKATSLLLTKWLQMQSRWIRRDQPSRLLTSTEVDAIDILVV